MWFLVTFGRPHDLLVLVLRLPPAESDVRVVSGAELAERVQEVGVASSSHFAFLRKRLQLSLYA